MKQKIENRKQLNDFFKKVNEEVDKYLIEHQIKPSRLAKYIISNGGIDKFVEEIGLSEIDGINKVVDQVLKSRVHMERDGIMKFESFRLNEDAVVTGPSLLTVDVLFDTIGKATIEHEKILGDYFDTSLGHIEEFNALKHLYIVDSTEGKYYAYAFTDSDMDTMFNNIKEFVYNNIPLEVEVKLTANKSISIPVTEANVEAKVNSLDVTSILEELFSDYTIEKFDTSSDNHNEAIVIYKKSN
jgi:hypothetical protein